MMKSKDYKPSFKADVVVLMSCISDTVLEYLTRNVATMFDIVGVLRDNQDLVLDRLNVLIQRGYSKIIFVSQDQQDLDGFILALKKVCAIKHINFSTINELDMC